MSRYIDADELTEFYEPYKDMQVPVNALLEQIKDTSTVDVVEVRHGKWSHDYIKDGMEYSDWFNLHCSVCGQMQFSTFGKWNYCPNCGARMDEKGQEND